MPNTFSDRSNDTAGSKPLSPAEGGNISDSFSLFHSKFPWSHRDISRESKGSRKRDALGWSSAIDLSCDPGMEGAHDKWAVLQRESSAQEQLLCKAQQG